MAMKSTRSASPAGAPDPRVDPEFDRLTQAELRAWGGFLRTHARIVRRLDAEMRAAHGLSLSAYEVLLHLAFALDRRCRMSALAESVLLTPSGITRLVDRLVRDGLVERYGDDCDQRATLAVLTQTGYERLRDAQRTHLQGVRRAFLSRRSREDLAALAEMWDGAAVSE
jgi:DNA-binding MarR family transcriptional regulator